MKTTAEKIADLLGDDGTNFFDADRVSLEYIVARHGGQIVFSDGWGNFEYRFADGSEILVWNSTCWDLTAEDMGSRPSEQAA